VTLVVDDKTGIAIWATLVVVAISLASIFGVQSILDYTHQRDDMICLIARLSQIGMAVAAVIGSLGVGYSVSNCFKSSIKDILAR